MTESPKRSIQKWTWGGDKQAADILAKMSARLDVLEKKFTKFGDEMTLHDEKHVDEHLALDKMVFMSFYRAHPECVADLKQADKIMGVERPVRKPGK